jgi:hypothetical protein
MRPLGHQVISSAGGAANHRTADPVDTAGLLHRAQELVPWTPRRDGTPQFRLYASTVEKLVADPVIGQHLGQFIERVILGRDHPFVENPSSGSGFAPTFDGYQMLLELSAPEDRAAVVTLISTFVTAKLISPEEVQRLSSRYQTFVRPEIQHLADEVINAGTLSKRHTTRSLSGGRYGVELDGADRLIVNTESRVGHLGPIVPGETRVDGYVGLSGPNGAHEIETTWLTPGELVVLGKALSSRKESDSSFILEQISAIYANGDPRKLEEFRKQTHPTAETVPVDGWRILPSAETGLVVPTQATYARSMPAAHVGGGHLPSADLYSTGSVPTPASVTALLGFEPRVGTTITAAPDGLTFLRVDPMGEAPPRSPQIQVGRSGAEVTRNGETQPLSPADATSLLSWLDAIAAADDPRTARLILADGVDRERYASFRTKLEAFAAGTPLPTAMSDAARECLESFEALLSRPPESVDFDANFGLKIADGKLTAQLATSYGENLSGAPSGTLRLRDARTMPPTRAEAEIEPPLAAALLQVLERERSRPDSALNQVDLGQLIADLVKIADS